MDRTTKILIAVLGGILVVCLCLGGLGFFALRKAGQALEQTISSVADPTSAAEVAGSIAEFDIPPGHELRALSFFGFDMVMLVPDNFQSGSFITMMQFPTGMALSRDEMEAQMRQGLAQQQFGRSLQNMQYVGELQTSIRGKEVSLSVFEGRDENGLLMQEVTGIFEGIGGPTMLMILGPAETWGSSGVDEFLRSMR
ncbi:MAG TPA: hypothetical protein VJ123_00450 [Anaerolineales bacterium]|nr:hypothetical protein [Anaerolineales bacterium]